MLGESCEKCPFISKHLRIWFVETLGFLSGVAAMWLWMKVHDSQDFIGQVISILIGGLTFWLYWI